MKTFIGLVLALASTFAVAQTAEWKLSEIKDKGNSPVGYIYHSYSVGTSSTGMSKAKVVTGLRLICSVKGVANPLIAIYWDAPMQPEVSQVVMWSLDSKPVRSTESWKQDDKILYSSFTDSPELITALKSGKTISATWVDKYGVRRAAAYGLDGFSSHLNEFNSACKL